MRLSARIVACIALVSCGLAPALTSTAASAATSAHAGHGAAAGEKPQAPRPAGAGDQVAGGTRLWMALYKGSNGDGQATAVAASPDGSKVFVTGLNGASSPHEFYGTVAYDSDTGARVWTASYRGPAGNNSPAAIAVSPDGSKVFVTGSSGTVGANTIDYATVAYEAATGARLWTAHYYGPGRQSPCRHRGEPGRVRGVRHRGVRNHKRRYRICNGGLRCRDGCQAVGSPLHRLRSDEREFG